MSGRIAILIFLSLLFQPAYAPAVIILVPADQPTIQDGIDAAWNGDMVVVANGTYTGSGNIDLDFGGKIISVKSINGPSNCVIDCQNNGRGFYFHSGETEKAVVQGFTIQNGDVLDYGGGIMCSNASPTITGNIISGCTAGLFGGGLYCSNGSPRVINNTFSGNAAEEGGAIYCDAAYPEIMYNTISGNMAAETGGGLASSYACPTIMHNIISGNSSLNGGGLWLFRSSGPPAVFNNIITGNWAMAWGGGIYCRGSSPALDSNTIADNTADLDGGGFCNHSQSSMPVATNTIFWGNTAATGDEIWVGYSSTFTIKYSNVEGGQASVYVGPNATLNWGSGMMDADPLFVPGPLGDYYLSQISAGNALDSPCLDAGDGMTGQILSQSSRIPVGTTQAYHELDDGVLDLGCHYSIIGIANGDGPYFNRPNRKIFFDASSSFDPYGTIIGYRWDWTNDGTWDTEWLSDPIVKYSYGSGFHGQARLQVMDSDYNTNTDLVDVDIILFPQGVS